MQGPESNSAAVLLPSGNQSQVECAVAMKNDFNIEFLNIQYFSRKFVRLAESPF